MTVIVRRWMMPSPREPSRASRSMAFAGVQAPPCCWCLDSPSGPVAHPAMISVRRADPATIPVSAWRLLAAQPLLRGQDSLVLGAEFVWKPRCSRTWPGSAVAQMRSAGDVQPVRVVLAGLEDPVGEQREGVAQLLQQRVQLRRGSRRGVHQLVSLDWNHLTCERILSWRCRTIRAREKPPHQVEQRH